ncbi:MAG: arsenate reductase (glutaredoxin) [Pseudomonadota bacterium]
MKIYHNPRCSKSRAALALLEENGVDVEVIRYLETPPDAPALKTMIAALGVAPRDLLRVNEAPYKELKLCDLTLSDEALIDAMAAHPILIERPIVVDGDRAVIGRPPESVLTLI